MSKTIVWISTLDHFTFGVKGGTLQKSGEYSNFEMVYKPSRKAKGKGKQLVTGLSLKFVPGFIRNGNPKVKAYTQLDEDTRNKISGALTKAGLSVTPDKLFADIEIYAHLQRNLIRQMLY